jgi:benzylsuccinate CoA-transferase BbsF subunit
MDKNSIFKDIKVVEFTIFGIGPLAGKLLADFGATVVRVESIERPDPTRLFPAYKDGKTGVNRSYFWANNNTSKLSIELNLNNPESVKMASRLVKWADIVIENFRPGVLENWGLAYEEMRKINPHVILVRLSNMGHHGPYSGQRGTGGTLQSLAGFSFLTGWPDRDPAPPFGAICDQYPPLLAVTAIISALLYRRRTGKGQYIEFSQLEGSVLYLAPLLLDYQINGHILNRMGNRSSCAAPHGVYRCEGADRWCAIAIFTEKQWRSFREVIGNPIWAKEERFSTLTARKENEDALDRFVEEWTITKTPEEVMTLLQTAGTPAGVVENVEDMFSDPQLQYRKHFVKLEHPEIDSYSAPNHAFRMSKTSCKMKAAPCLGEHTELVCREMLGMTDEEFINSLINGEIE